MSDEGLDALLDAYLLGEADAAQAADLEAMLRADSEARRALVERAMLEVHLYRACAVDSQSAAERSLPAAPARRGLKRAWLAGLAVAAAVAVAVGATLLLRRGRRAEGSHEVVSGAVVVAGSPVTRIPGGSSVRVAGTAPAVIRLSDRSQATLEPSSRAVLHGRMAEAREVVELIEGGGRFLVPKGRGRFEVRTSVGRVTVLGTEFSVRLVPEGHDGQGGEPMKTRHVLMAVAVLAGSVQVEVGGRAVVLGVGGSRVFAAEREGPRTRRVSGEITAMNANTLTLTQRGDRGERTQTVAIGAGTKVLIETDEMETVAGEGDERRTRRKLAEATAAELQVGMRVTATVGADGEAVSVVARKPRAPRRRGEGEREREGRTRKRRLSGELTSVNGNALEITRRGDRGADVTSVTLDANSAIQVETDEMVVVRGEGDEEHRRPKIVAGTAADLKAGMRVTVTAGEDGKVLMILIHRPRPRREGGEREREREAGPREPRRRREGGGREPD